MNWVQELALKYESETIKNRRHLHSRPELGFHEAETSDYVAQKLLEYGVEVHRGFGTLKTGVMGIIRGEGSRVLNLRADIDALAIQEEANACCCSKYAGKMHACGHDAHTAMLLSAARILSENRDKVHGTVKLVFQPAEEGPYPGGACSVIESGAIDDADGAFAMHVTPDLPVGQVNLHRGTGTASADMFTIELIGKGGHGSEPAKAIDPVVMAAQVVNAFQSVISRGIDARDASVLSICTIHGGNAGNVIPEKVTMTGTLRNFDEAVRNTVVKNMEAILEGIASMYGGRYSFAVDRGYPALLNDDHIVELAGRACKKVFEEQNVYILTKPIMGGEDFAYVSRKIPAAMVWLGCGNEEQGMVYPLHSPNFQMDEQCLSKGVALFVEFAMEFFNDK